MSRGPVCDVSLSLITVVGALLSALCWVAAAAVPYLLP
jgi:hypothetical protein